MTNREVNAWTRRADELGLANCVARGNAELERRELERSKSKKRPHAATRDVAQAHEGRGGDHNPGRKGGSEARTLK